MASKAELNGHSKPEIKWVVIKLPVAGPEEMAESAIPKKSSFTSKNKYRSPKSSKVKK
jgi:hypothetical protein